MFRALLSHVNCNGFNLPEMIVSLIRQQLLSFGKRPKGSKKESLTSEQVEAAEELETNCFSQTSPQKQNTASRTRDKTIGRRQVSLKLRRTGAPEHVSLSVMSSHSDHCLL